MVSNLIAYPVVRHLTELHIRMYQLLVTGRGDMAVFETAGLLAASVDIAMGIIQCTVQLFFAWRLHSIGHTLYPDLAPRPISRFSARDFIIAKQHWITGFICLASFGTLVGGVGTGIAMLLVKDYSRFASFAPIALTSGFSTLSADITITAAMTYHLHRAKGSFKRTDRLLDRVIRREY